MDTNNKTTSALSITASDALPVVQYARPAARGARASRRQVVLLGGLLVLVVVPLFVSLGLWQWRKADAKLAIQAELDQRSHDAPVTLSATPVDPAALRHHRVELRGTFDPAHQVLIDNRLYRGQAGYHVITPLRLAGTGMSVLVNRGWVAAPPDHQQLPDVPPPPAMLTLTGIATVPPTRFFTLAPPQRGWASVWQNPDLERFRSTLPYPVQPVIVLLDPAAPGGYVREWPRPDERADRHRSYALQWFGFAAASLAIWGYFLGRRP